MKNDKSQIKIAVVGIGYVGFPLAVFLARSGFTVVGFDVSESRILQLRDQAFDNTGEFQAIEFQDLTSLSFSSNEEAIQFCNVYIITVPTPVDRANVPDLALITAASKTVGKYLSDGDLVVYESTVYPGLTNQHCRPILEAESGLSCDDGNSAVGANCFMLGYSPERINPADKDRKLPGIKKIIGAASPRALDLMRHIYSSIIDAGLHEVSSIEVAEAAKIIENAQRDLNIAFVNEISMFFRSMGLTSTEVLEAAGTKWNFLSFHPGLVGGHCIGVDPYYLTHCAAMQGHHLSLTSEARRINDGMAQYLLSQLMYQMAVRGVSAKNCKVLICGLTFKEDCPDVRNSGAVRLIRELKFLGLSVAGIDPVGCPEDLKLEYGKSINLVDDLDNNYDCIIMLKEHKEFRTSGFAVKCKTSLGEFGFMMLLRRPSQYIAEMIPNGNIWQI